MNDVLDNDEEVLVPNIMKKDKLLNPLSRYSIDRYTLINKNLSMDTIDSIYRSLFVHSLGYFGILQDATANLVKDKVDIQTNIWKVFKILLKFANKGTYESIQEKI